MTDPDLRTHPIFEKLVPLLAAAPADSAPHVVTIRFRDGQPQHVMPDYALPASPHAALFRLPWPAPVPPAVAAVCARIAVWLPGVVDSRQTGDLVVRIAAPDCYELRWRGSLPLRPLPVGGR